MLTEFSFPMTSLGTERTIRVYLPPSYHDSGKSYPVLYMHDGQNVFRDADAIGGVSLGMEAYLDARGLDLVIVGIDSNPVREERINELCPWVNGDFATKILGYKSTLGGKGQQYMESIVKELKPWIDGKFRTMSNRTYLAGISLGGLISTFAACRYPHIFTRIAGISSGFYRNQEEIEHLLRTSNLSSIERFYLDCGTKEGGDDDDASKTFVVSNETIYDLVKARIPHARFRVIDGARHHYEAFRDRFPKILSFLCGDV